MNDALSAFLQLIDAPQSATRDARLPDAARALLATLADPVEGQGVDRRRALVRLAEVSAELRPRDRRRLVSATRATFAETASALKDGPRSLYLAYVILVTMALAPSGLVPATGEALAELEGERVDLPGTLGELLPEDDPDRRPVGGLQDLEQDLGRMLAALQGGRLEEALELQPKLLVRFEDAKGRGAEAAAAVLRGAFERGARQVESGAGLRDLAEAFGPLLVEGDLPHHPLAKLLVAAAPLPKSPASPGVPDTPLFLDRLLERMEEKDERLSPLLRRAEIGFPLLQRIEARAAAQTQVTSWADRADMWVERYTNRLSQLDRRLGILDALFGSGRDPFERLRLGRFADFDGFESFGAGAQRLGFVLPITMPDGSTGMGFEGFGLDLPNFSFPGMPGMPGGMPAFPGMIQGAGSFGGAFPNLAGMNLPPALKAMISSGQLPASALQQLRSGRLASLFGGSGGASRGLRGLQTLLRGSGAMRHLALGLAGGGMSAGSFPGFSGFSLPQLRQASLGSMPGGMSFASLARSGGGGLPPRALPASLRSLSGGGGRSFAGLGGLDLSRFPGFAGLSSGSMPRFSGGFSGGGFGGAGFARSLSGGFGGLSLGSLP
ncbi:MAG TPA: hypothetical protein DEA08_28355, partial [Planctomycetes bacterium]|nr:hypothetical protein [Planctomycetota bacterium]